MSRRIPVNSERRYLFKMKNLIIALIVGLGCWQLYGKFAPLKLPEQLSFSDISGVTHQLDTDPNEPYLIVPWIDNCPFSARSLEAVENFVKSSRVDRSEVYALYVNLISDDQLKKHDKVKRSNLIHMAAQKDVLVFRDLYEGLLTQVEYMPGDFFIVNPGGKVEHVATRELSQADFLPTITDTIKSSFL